MRHMEPLAPHSCRCRGGALATITLLLPEFLPPQNGEADVRHIISAFKLTLSGPNFVDQGKNGFQALIDSAPADTQGQMAGKCCA